MSDIDLIKCLDGNTFEEFIIKEIFNFNDYDILEKSHSKHLTPYYVHSNNNPDFKLRCKQTKIEFWIECKYLQMSFIDSVDEIPIKKEQFLRYSKLKEPVYYVYGIGIYAQVIEEVFIIPYKNIYPEKIFKSHLEKFEVKIERIKNFNELIKLTT